MADRKAFEGWAIVELMGHRRVGAYVTEDTLAGAGFLRLEIPGATAAEPNLATQFVAPSSVYCLTPTTEELARAVAQSSKPQPVARWELPKPEDVETHDPCDNCGERNATVKWRDIDERLCDPCADTRAKATP